MGGRKVSTLEERLADIKEGLERRSWTEAGYAHDVVPFLLSLVREQQNQINKMRKALQKALVGAKHESCEFGADDPDPTFHCCDWNEVVLAIEAALVEPAYDLFPSRETYKKKGIDCGI